MRDTTSETTLLHLTAERSWYESATEHLCSLASALTAEMSSRVPPADRSVSWRRVLSSYYNLTPEGSEYAQLCRDLDDPPHDVRGGSPQTQVLLDPATLVDGSAYLDLGVSLVSADERLLAYSVDRTGDEVYELAFRDLDAMTDLPDRVTRSYAGGAWSADSSTFFYLVPDEAGRAHEVRRHRLGSPASTDEVVLAEPDARFSLTVRTTRSGDWVVLRSASYETSEVWMVDAHQPGQAPLLVQPRRHGVLYQVEHARTPDGGALVVLTNDGATEFRLLLAPADGTVAEPRRWRELVAEDPLERLHRVDAFASYLVVSLRRGGVPLLRVLGLDGTPLHDIACSLTAGTIRLARNELFGADAVTVVEESYVQPPVWIDVDLRSGTRVERHRQLVPGHDPARYVTERLQVPAQSSDPAASDVLVPATLVRHRDTPLDGSAPVLMWGYGAYESCDDPEFQVALPSLLDRGVVFVQTHPRGGGECGRRWWLDGRLEAKQHTFDDHLTVAEHLVVQGWVDGERVATRGLSAGGLLQAAMFSQRPDRWRAVVAEVPFVDVVTTMLDPSIPLTVEEWDEWGDPRRPEDFAWMLAYSPYDNLPPAGTRPDLLVTGALHDARVMVWEPAKWVAALRATDPAWSPRCLFRVELGEGAHSGPSGRYAELAYEAAIHAWVLDRVGRADVST
jgi:oligopeptidase B